MVEPSGQGQCLPAFDLQAGQWLQHGTCSVIMLMELNCVVPHPGSAIVLLRVRIGLPGWSHRNIVFFLFLPLNRSDFIKKENYSLHFDVLLRCFSSQLSFSWFFNIQLNINKLVAFLHLLKSSYRTSLSFSLSLYHPLQSFVCPFIHPLCHFSFKNVLANASLL